MKRIKLTYDNQTDEVIELIKQDYILVCPRCNSDLTIYSYINPETKEKLPSLIDCPNNPNHYGLHFHYNTNKFWEKVDERSEEKQHT